MNVRLLLLTTLLHLNSVMVSGNYNLSITVHSYTNVNNLCMECRDEGIGCCDDFESRRCTNPGSGSRCETYFEYCLLPLNTVASGGPVGCRVRARSDPATDDSAINFAQSMVLGLSNPLVLREPLSTWTGIQVQITAIDKDSSNDDLIDFFQLNINPSDTSGFSNLNGYHSIAQMSLSYLVDLDNCIGIDCSGQGYCIDGQNSYTCVCNSGFTGANCETNFNDCVGVTCGGRGTCVDGVNSFTCSCNLGFTGALCQTNINDCVGIDCSGNGHCMDGVNSFTCSCDIGFTGSLCQTNIDDCVGIDCSGNGQCMDSVDSFICSCNTGFTGTFCDTNIDDCVGIDCSGNGQCMDGAGSFICSCNTGFTGSLCDTNIDDCIGVDCSGNGQCVDGVEMSTCDCDSGYVGDNCQFEAVDGCSGTNCSDLIVNDGSSLGVITVVFIIGGTLGGFILLLILIIVILAAVISTSRQRSNTKQVTDPPPKQHHHERERISLNYNVGYGGPALNFTGEDQGEVIYDEIGSGAAVGCRRHGVYAGNNEEMNEMEPYAVYDMVL